MKIEFQTSFLNLPRQFYEEVTPASVEGPSLIAFNSELANSLNISFDLESDEQEIVNTFSGNKTLEGSRPVAMAYAGHQFGHFVPQLGDGRALLLGEVIAQDGRNYDIQLKGSGPTPFSRNGDGRSSLGPVLREYIVSEAMYHLGVPTTRALCAVRTGENVFREEELPGGVFTRVSSSHIRVGTFEYFAARSDTDNLKLLLDYCVDRYYPKLERDADLPLRFLKEVMNQTSSLTAHWMDLGFIHGVMNTDNCSIAGLTIDYGPCAFMDEFKIDKVFSYIDRRGRYAYGNQANIALWNMGRLAECLLLLMDYENEKVKKRFQETLEEFPKDFEIKWMNRMRQKIGLYDIEEKDGELVNTWLNILQENELDYTASFRSLSESLNNDKKSPELDRVEGFEGFWKQWKERVERQGADLKAISSQMNDINPLYIPRNHVIEEIIENSIKGNDELFHKVLEIIKSPFTHQTGAEFLQEIPKKDQRVQNTFCGT